MTYIKKQIIINFFLKSNFDFYMHKNKEVKNYINLDKNKLNNNKKQKVQ